MVVALGATVGQAHEGRPDRVSDIEQDFGAPLHEDGGVGLVRVVAVEAGGDARLGAFGPELVTGDLFLHEAVIGLVGVESVDHVVAVAPGVRARLVGFEALALGIARQVEPVPRPPFAVARRSEQAVHELGEGVGGIVPHERIDFLGRGRQPGQVERRAADQGDFVCARRKLQLLCGQPGADESVNRIACGVRRHHRRGHRLEGPVGTLPFAEPRRLARIGGQGPCRRQQQRSCWKNGSEFHRHFPSHITMVISGAFCQDLKSGNYG